MSSILSQPSTARLIPQPFIAHPGPLILALPGSGCSPRIFDGLRVDDAMKHAVDWGTGPRPISPEAVSARLARELAERRSPTLLLGHSAGCVIAMLTCLAVPSRIDGLMLSNSGAQARGHGDPGLPDKIRSAWAATTQLEFLRACFEKQPPPLLWEELCRYLQQLGGERLLEAVNGVRGVDLSAELHAIGCPTVIAHGEHDHRRPVVFAEQLAAGIPNARLILLPGGHTPMVDCPTEYQAAFDTLLEAARLARNKRLHPPTP